MNVQNSVNSESIVKQLFFKATVVLLLLITIAVGAWYVITAEEKSLQKVENQKVKELNGLISQVNFLRSQVKLYALYGDKYKDLVRKGVVKKQDRVFWVDSMVQMQESLVMPDFTFKFSPESVLNSESFTALRIEKNIFYFSRLDVKMGLQHEGDLLTFLEAVNARVSPLYLVESCRSEMSKKELDDREDVNFDLEKGNVKVDCSFIVFHTHAKLVL